MGLIRDGAVLGGNRNPAFSFQRIGIEHAIRFVTIEQHGPAVGQQRVYERGLAVIDMGDDRYVSQIGVSGVQHGQPRIVGRRVIGTQSRPNTPRLG